MITLEEKMKKKKYIDSNFIDSYIDNNFIEVSEKM